MTHPYDETQPGTTGQPFSRRRLFEVGGATVGLAAFLAACSQSDAPAAGRVGNAPVPTDLPSVEVNDVVFLRTMSSLEHSILAAYDVLGGLPGLSEPTTAALRRFTDDHTAIIDSLAKLATDEGGEPYECANDWLMDRAIQPALDNIVGRSARGDDAEIPPTDDVDRDARSVMNGLETLASATYQQMVEKLSAPALRAAVIPFGAQAARHAAVVVIIAVVGDENRLVSPVLLGEEVTPEGGFLPQYAIPSRFGQLTPIDVVIGAKNDLDLRFTATFETPADNAYRYEGMACPPEHGRQQVMGTGNTVAYCWYPSFGRTRLLGQ